MKIGIFGAGTVGGGVIKILEKQKKNLLKQGFEFEIVKCCVRKPKKYCDKISKNIKLVKKPSDILEDKSIDTIIEVIGGTGLAKDIIFQAIKKGKNVITANKAVIAENLSEVENLLKQNPSVLFGYEASVGGGIPIIQTLQNELLSDNISKISGIFNGTTNFILSKMEQEALTYKEVLQEAQDLGYAESDPTADVGGFDARAKLAILIKLALGVIIDENKIYTKGIEQVTAVDFSYAKEFNSSIKLIALAENNNSEISAYVSPVLISKENKLAKINGVSNAVKINSEFLEESLFVGSGAGRFPTANSIVSDLLSVASKSKTKAFPLSCNIPFESGFSAQFYIRFQIKDGIGIVKQIGTVCEKYGVSIYAISQLPIGNSKDLPFILTTEKTTKSAIEFLVDDISKLDFCNEKPFYMPIIN